MQALENRRMLNLIFAAALATGAPGPEADLSWIAGDWRLCESGRVIEERWMGPQGGLMVGANLTFERGKASFESLRIARDKDGWAYISSPGGAPPTVFRLIDQRGTSAVFANPDHDFPKRITYAREGDAMTARIEGPIDGKPVEFSWRFEKGDGAGC